MYYTDWLLNKRDDVMNEEVKEQSVDKGQELAQSILSKKDKWDGRILYKILKFLIIIAIIVVGFLELFFVVWPKVKHNFPEDRPIQEKCREAKCDNSCNGECSCVYVNKYQKEENITCIIER